MTRLDREPMTEAQAAEYFRGLFQDVASVIKIVLDWGDEADKHLPYATVRIHPAERKALNDVLLDYATANTQVVMKLTEDSYNGELEPHVLTMMTAPMIMMGILVGYRHACNEIDIPLEFEEE